MRSPLALLLLLPLALSAGSVAYVFTAGYTDNHVASGKTLEVQQVVYPDVGGLTIDWGDGTVTTGVTWEQLPIQHTLTRTPTVFRIDNILAGTGWQRRDGSFFFETPPTPWCNRLIVGLRYTKYPFLVPGFADKVSVTGFSYGDDEGYLYHICPDGAIHSGNTPALQVKEVVYDETMVAFGPYFMDFHPRSVLGKGERSTLRVPGVTRADFQTMAKPTCDTWTRRHACIDVICKDGTLSY